MLFLRIVLAEMFKDRAVTVDWAAWVRCSCSLHSSSAEFSGASRKRPMQVDAPLDVICMCESSHPDHRHSHPGLTIVSSNSKLRPVPFWISMGRLLCLFCPSLCRLLLPFTYACIRFAFRLRVAWDHERRTVSSHEALRHRALVSSHCRASNSLIPTLSTSTFAQSRYHHPLHTWLLGST